MEIKRDITEKLLQWKNSASHKPLLIKGARQIGKTWLMRKFGKEHFEYVAEFNFDRTNELHNIFAATKDTARLLKELSAISDVPILPEKTLMIFDEIQEDEAALNSLKYFCEDAPEYHIMAAGSLLGVAVRKKSMTVPVGKVRIMDMLPLTFSEFLRASDPDTYEKLDRIDSIEPLPELTLNKAILEYRRYMVCGGMPEAAITMIGNKGKNELEDVLQDILDMYELDFSKYASPIEVVRINALWKSLPSQLAKENRKFIYNVVRSGARAREYEDALIWLEKAGLLHRVFCITKPGIPLGAYAETNAFKAYAADCGLLRRLAKVPPEVFFSNAAGFIEFKGAVAENAVLNSLLSQFGDTPPYYWTSGNQAEVDFIQQTTEGIIPMEVKSDTCIRGKSLAVYNAKYSPPLRVRYSMNNLKANDGLLSIPLPLADRTEKIIRIYNSITINS